MKFLLIDGNSIGFAAHRTTKLHAGTQEVQAVFGFMKSLRSLLGTYKDYMPIVLWDGRSWRKDVSADYKANRDKDPRMVIERESYKPQKVLIARGLKLLGVKQAFSVNMEADDLAAMFVDKLKDHEIVLVTGDKDWLQLVDDNVIWYDPIRDNTVNIHTFEEFTGYKSPEHFVQGKCLHGDVSDNVKGVGGIGEKGAEEFMRCFDAVQDFFDAPMDAKWPKKWIDFHSNAKGGHENYAKNQQLMNLRTTMRPKPENYSLIKNTIDEDGFSEFCGELAFHSILRDFDNWMKPFRS